jgi:hypothetical protein
MSDKWDLMIDKIYQTWYASLSWEEKDVEKYEAARAALRAEIAKVEQELKEWKNHAYGLEKGYIIFGATKECCFCHKWEASLEPIKHTDDCPVSVFRARLAKGSEA